MAAGNLGDAQTVVAGSAIRPDNPELAAARAAGLPVLHRSEALAATMADDTVVAVAGTHGKSTTTSMITVLLQGAGLDPSFAIGANVPALGVNAAQRQLRDLRRRGRRVGRLLPELPPADRRGHQRRAGPPGLLRHRRGRLCLLRPLHGPAAGRRRPGGLRGRRRRAGAGAAHPRTRQHPGGPVRDVGGRRRPAGRCPAATTPDRAGSAISTTAGTVRRRAPGPGPAQRAERGRRVRRRARTRRRPGGRGRALADFSGASRRFEFKGEGRGIRVYDDYAHHPTEVRAALSAARSVAGQHKVHVLFQPHLFSRTREFARNSPTPSTRRTRPWFWTSIRPAKIPFQASPARLIADHLGPAAAVVGPGAEAVQALLAAAAPGDIVLTAGAGDVTAYGPQIVDALTVEAAGG